MYWKRRDELARKGYGEDRKRRRKQTKNNTDHREIRESVQEKPTTMHTVQFTHAEVTGGVY